MVGPRWAPWAWLAVPALWAGIRVGCATGALPVALHDPAVWGVNLGWWALVILSVIAGFRGGRTLTIGRWFAGVGGYLALLVPLALVGAWVSGRVTVQTAGMEPALLQGDGVVVAEGPALGTVHAGDVVVYAPEGPDGPRWIRRVVATAGDRVEVKGGELLVDGLRAASDPATPGQRIDREGCGWSEAPVAVEVIGEAAVSVRPGGRTAAPLVVPSGAVYVLGDDRARSLDSRHRGPVPLDRITGRVLGVAWPSWHCGRFALSRLGQAP